MTPAPTPTQTPIVSGNPYAEARPSRGGPNVEVTVFGGGFPANRRVNLHLATFDGQVGRQGGAIATYASTMTDQQGSYRMTFTTPATWPDGTHLTPGMLLLLVATDEFMPQASAIYTYVPPPRPTATRPPAPTATPTRRNAYATVSPSSGSAGTHVTVHGGGFPANRAVGLYMSGVVRAAGVGQGPTAYATTTTDAKGDYRLRFVMPGAWPNGAKIEAGKLALLVATADFAVRATGSFDYAVPAPRPTNTPTPAPTATKTPAPTTTPTRRNPYVTVNPSSGSAGTRVTVRGGGFPANSAVGLYMAGVVRAAGVGQAPHAYATTTTDARGDYRMSFTMPATWPGGVRIEAGRLSLLVATTDFSVRATSTFDYLVPTPTPPSVPAGNPSAEVSPSSGGSQHTRCRPRWRLSRQQTRQPAPGQV